MPGYAPVAVRSNSEPVVIKSCNGSATCEHIAKTEAIEMVRVCETPIWEREVSAEGIAVALAGPLIGIMLIFAFVKWINRV